MGTALSHSAMFTGMRAKKGEECYGMERRGGGGGRVKGEVNYGGGGSLKGVVGLGGGGGG